jgi:hypothetical protein
VYGIFATSCKVSMKENNILQSAVEDIEKIVIFQVIGIGICF